MAKGPNRRHSQMTHTAKLRWNAANQSRVVEIRELSLLSEPDRQLTTTHIWPIFLTRPSRLLRPLKMPTPVWISKRCRHCHVPCEGLAPSHGINVKPLLFFIYYYYFLFFLPSVVKIHIIIIIIIIILHLLYYSNPTQHKQWFIESPTLVCCLMGANAG